LRGPPSVSHPHGHGADYPARCDRARHPHCDGTEPMAETLQRNASPIGPAHPPCSRLDIRLAAAVAGSAGGLLHHLFHPSPSRAGSVCCCSCRHTAGQTGRSAQDFGTAVPPPPTTRGESARSREPTGAAPVLAVSHGNHLCGSREVPLVEPRPRAAEP
jgi:hypothetical protein